MNLSTALLNLMLLINVSVCYASPRARKKPDSPIAIISEQTIIEKAKKSGYEVTFIDGSTCNDSLNPNRTLIFCHHKGKAVRKSSLVSYNLFK
jgi:DNA repair photolyase